MKKGRSSGTRGPDASIIKTGAVLRIRQSPRFNGDLQIFQTIVKSNGWTDETAALAAVCAFGWGGPKRGPTDARGRAGRLERTLTMPVGLL